jgi:hypothetical protein
MTPDEAAATVRAALEAVGTAFGFALAERNRLSLDEMRMLQPRLDAARPALGVLVAAAQQADRLAQHLHDLDQPVPKDGMTYAELLVAAARADRLEEALRMMMEAYERHNEWCGNLASAPGASIHWQARNSARAALAEDGEAGEGEVYKVVDIAEMTMAAWNEALATARAKRDEAARRADRLAEALRFYADPETYLAIGFLPDPPCGEFMDDFDDQGPQLGMKPGRRARAVLAGEAR